VHYSKAPQITFNQLVETAKDSNSFLPEPLFIISSLSAEFVSVQLGLYNSAPIAYCVSGRLIPLSIDGTQQFLILSDLPPGAMRLLSAGDGYKKLVRLLFSNDQSLYIDQDPSILIIHEIPLFIAILL
jgi:hypothetical protein